MKTAAFNMLRQKKTTKDSEPLLLNEALQFYLHQFVVFVLLRIDVCDCRARRTDGFLNVKCSTYFKTQVLQRLMNCKCERNLMLQMLNVLSHTGLHRLSQTDYNIRAESQRSLLRCLSSSLLKTNCAESLITCHMKLQYYLKLTSLILFLFSSPHQ